MNENNSNEELDIYKSLSDDESNIEKPISPKKKKRVVRRTKPPTKRTLECLEAGRAIRAENVKKLQAKNDEYLELKKELQAEHKLKLEKLKTELKVNRKTKEEVLPIVKEEYKEKQIKKEALEKARKDLEDELTRKITKKLRRQYVKSKYISEDSDSDYDSPVKTSRKKKVVEKPITPIASPQKPSYRIVYF